MFMSLCLSTAEYTVNLPENSAPGKSLIQLSCVDKDEGANGQFSFMIKSGINQVYQPALLLLKLSFL